MTAAAALLFSSIIGAHGSVLHHHGSVMHRGSVTLDVNKQVEHIIARDVAPMVSATGAGGAAVVVYIRGRTLFFNYGFADQTKKQPITSDSLFNVGSVRKVFDAALVAQAVERGELRLDDPVNKYVGELQGDYIRRVTIGQLVTHTSGLLLPTDHPPWPQEHYSLSGFLDALNAWTPKNGEEPGKQRIYSHAGYILLQLVLEHRYGRPIAELIARDITKPLGMNSTVLPERGPDDRAILGPELMQRTVQGYSYGGDPVGLPGNQQGYYDFPGAGQMFSSARDLAILLAACLGDASVETGLRRALQSTRREFFRVNSQFGQAMAWEVADFSNTGIVDKPAGLDNASAFIGLVPQSKIGLVLLLNRGDVAPSEVTRTRTLPDLARIPRTPMLANTRQSGHVRLAPKAE